MCKNLLKDTRECPTLPGVWDFYPLKITPPSSAGMYLSPRNRREALLQGDANQDPPTGLLLLLLQLLRESFPYFFKPCVSLLRAKDRLNEDGDPCPALAVSEHQPDNGVGRDNCSELGLQ